MKVWISKYALTEGLRQDTGRTLKSEFADAGLSFITDGIRLGGCKYLRDGEWHETYEQAAERAEVMRLAKIRSYEKRLKQLKAMKFEVEE